MLVITRRKGDATTIGTIIVDITAIGRENVTLGIDDLETPEPTLVDVPLNGAVTINQDVTVHVALLGRKIKLGIEAPRTMRVSRHNSATAARAAHAAQIAPATA